MSTTSTKPLTFCEQAILDCLEQYGGSTPKEISERTGMEYKSLYGQKNYMNDLKARDLVHIADWRRQVGRGGPPQPVYVLGPGEDANRLEPLSNYEKCRRYQRRIAKPRRSIVKAVLFAREMPCLP